MCLRIRAVYLAYGFRQIGIRGLDERMLVIVDQTPGITGPVELLDGLGEYVQEGVPINIVSKTPSRRSSRAVTRYRAPGNSMLMGRVSLPGKPDGASYRWCRKFEELLLVGNLRFFRLHCGYKGADLIAR